MTTTASRAILPGEYESVPDAGRLEQVLRLHDALLLGDVAPSNIAARICQGVAILLRATTVRLALLEDERLDVVATYGAPDRSSIDVAELRQAIADRRPAIATIAEGRRTLTIPLQGGNVAVVLQIVEETEPPVGPEHVALARYVGALAAIALRQAAQRERLEHASASKSEILIAMSHDLRSPLNVVLGYTRLLGEEAFGPCSPEQREVLGSIERYALELLSLLSGVLDLARVDAGREPRREEFSLAELFDELASGSLGSRSADGVELAWQVDPALPPLRTDRFRIRQILQNLVDNALRFTEQGSVRVTAERAGEGVRLSVTDSGRGIDPADLPHLFEVFRPGGGGTTRGAGTGCGLYLVKRYAESLGGRVDVRSTPGEGTCFTIDLPLPA